MPKTTICYVTSSDFKKEECDVLSLMELEDGVCIGDKFEFRFVSVNIKERLEINIETMVRSEVKEAYQAIKVPCIVEHAGLIFKKYYGKGYPGGLTKPMWNTLDESFVRETNSCGEEVVARAVVAYCDGRKIWTFEGETEGCIAKEPRRGKRVLLGYGFRSRG